MGCWYIAMLTPKFGVTISCYNSFSSLQKLTHWEIKCLAIKHTTTQSNWSLNLWCLNYKSKAPKKNPDLQLLYNEFKRTFKPTLLWVLFQLLKENFIKPFIFGPAFFLLFWTTLKRYLLVVIPFYRLVFLWMFDFIQMV